ncbi:cation diffusion facilitator family transporter, partial [Brevundimonas denitrificans]
VFIIYNAWSIVRTSFADLMDEELPDEEREKIIETACENPQVLGVHDLRTRRSGQNIFIQMHIDLDPTMNLTEAHAISEDVEMRVMALYPDAEAIIHQDPAPEHLLQAAHQNATAQGQE